MLLVPFVVFNPVPHYVDPPLSPFQYPALPHSLASFLRKTMKIFNWVHKRFHHHNNTLKDGFASNMKKTETTVNKVDSQALLKEVALTDLLGGWKDGILTIGTLGFDPLKSINHHKEYFALEPEGEGEHVLVDDDNDEKCYNSEQEELNPLMYNTFEHNFEDVVCENHDDANANKEEEVIRTFNEAVEVPPMICHDIMESNDVEDDQKKKGGERITLADLFLADSDVKLKLDYPANVMLRVSSEKPDFKAKHGLSFAKKIIPLVKDNSHPMKDIKKLMKKILKRKIHPDLDVKNLKEEGQKEVSEDINEDSDSSYFLPI